MLAKCSWWLVAAAFLPALAGAATDAEIVAWDAVTLRSELAAGRVSAERVTRVFLRRIASFDRSGPQLHAVIEVNPDALSIARALDRQRANGRIGALHGVPVLLKANIDTADRMATSAGSIALAEHRAVEDAELVERLRAAGAVLLGKTNMSEWANFRSTRSTSGWSSLGGQTRNPYVLDRNPCGSSSGSAVAVAARLAPLAVGTETDGSIVCPAATNGVVGVKPTAGAVSQRGLVPIAASQDTAGPLARSVADAALLLAVMTGIESAGVTHDGTGSLTGLRLGVVRNFQGAGTDPAVEAAFAVTLNSLSALGAEVVDPVNAPAAPDGAELAVLLYEFRDGIDRYLGAVSRGPQSLDELIAFNRDHAAQVLPYFGQELLLAAQARDIDSERRYPLSRASLAREREALADLFERLRLDALVAPANARAWRTELGQGDRMSVSSSSLAAVTGYPSVEIPISLAGELPLGIVLVGRPGSEPRLLEIGSLLERQRGEFPAPRFLPTVAE
jgi:amidase